MLLHPEDFRRCKSCERNDKCWSKEMLDICHVDIEQLPKLYESYEVAGTLRTCFCIQRILGAVNPVNAMLAVYLESFGGLVGRCHGWLGRVVCRL